MDKDTKVGLMIAFCVAFLFGSLIWSTYLYENNKINKMTEKGWVECVQKFGYTYPVWSPRDLCKE